MDASPPAQQKVRPIAEPDLVSALRWRYAVKKFDPARKIPVGTWETLEQALRLAPSSYGLQPWKFVVVSNAAMRERLLEASWGQRQIVDASHMVVFCVRTKVDSAFVEFFIEDVARTRGVDPKSLDGYKNMLLARVAGPEEEVEAWCARQVYLALGQFLTCAAVLGVDACPMEGIEPPQYDQILGLSRRGLKALAVATAGYRSSEDRYATQAKVRFSPSEVIEHIG